MCSNLSTNKQTNKQETKKNTLPCRNFENWSQGTSGEFQILNKTKRSPLFCKQPTCTKGQLISECLLGVIDLQKKKQQRKIWQISALESKKWSNQQSKITFLYEYGYIWLIGLLIVL